MFDKISQQLDYNKDIISRIEKLKRNTNVASGSFKYDWCYDECIDLIKSDIN